VRNYLKKKKQEKNPSQNKRVGGVAQVVNP
jgi:hypothetical protein